MVDLERHFKRFEAEYPTELSPYFFQRKFGHLPPSKCGAWIAEMERLHEIITSGCPVRSLESAFEVEATESEWDLYLNTFKEFRRQAAPLRPLLRDASQLPLVENFLHRQNMLFFAKYLQIIAGNTSPLGESLRRHSCQMVAVSYSDMAPLLQGEKKVLLIFKRPDGKHVAHIGFREGKVVYLSDYGFPVANIIEDASYQAVVFTPVRHK